MRVTWEYSLFDSNFLTHEHDGWRPFDPQGSSDQMETAWRHDSSNPQDGGRRLQIERGTYMYDIAFEAMTQSNLATR